MKLLIVTQKVDIQDDNLGFFHRWIEGFAEHYESIVVICLQKREFNLPANVRVLSLGKEKNFQFSTKSCVATSLLYAIFKFEFIRKIRYSALFYYYIIQL